MNAQHDSIQRTHAYLCAHPLLQIRGVRVSCLYLFPGSWHSWRPSNYVWVKGRLQPCLTLQAYLQDPSHVSLRLCLHTCCAVCAVCTRLYVQYLSPPITQPLCLLRVAWLLVAAGHNRHSLHLIVPHGTLASTCCYQHSVHAPVCAWSVTIGHKIQPQYTTPFLHHTPSLSIYTEENNLPGNSEDHPTPCVCRVFYCCWLLQDTIGTAST